MLGEKNMYYRALQSFCGAISMSKGEERVICDQQIASDLLVSGYIEVVETKLDNKKQKRCRKGKKS